MARTVGIGIQSFEKVIENRCFYVDKTKFIKEWWENGDDVTLIARPRRFGKTLTMSMLEEFLSIRYAGRGDLFEGLAIWQEDSYRQLQGTYPVISLSFANIKDREFVTVRKKMCQILTDLYSQSRFLLEGDFLGDKERDYFSRVSCDMDDATATVALYQLSGFLSRYYGKKVIILLDEYDTPLQEAFADGFWDDLTAFIRSLFSATFKTNPYLARAIMIGITRVSKESIFSDLNNLEVVTTTSEKYADCFGFTEEEVFGALEEYGLSEKKQDVKFWYDGFIFGKVRDIYNPWSILNYLDKRKLTAYWANTSSNSLVGKLIREGNVNIKTDFEGLLRGEHLRVPIDEQIIYNQLDRDETAIWSQLLASGYLKVLSYEEEQEGFDDPEYELALTNHEVKRMFGRMVRGWFGNAFSDYNDFVKALLMGDCRAMNVYMNRVALASFSFFRESDESKSSLLDFDDHSRLPDIGNDVWKLDTGKNPSRSEPERFYHGFVLGLIVELSGRYVITSNRESGFGRYDVMLESKKQDDAVILEFKVHDPEKEETLSDTVKEALLQIDRQNYEALLLERGIPKARIRKYGFTFKGKNVLIG